MGTMRITVTPPQPASLTLLQFSADYLYTTFALNHAQIVQVWVFFPPTWTRSPGPPRVHALQQPIKKTHKKITFCIHYLLTVKESKLIKVIARLNEKNIRI